MCDTSDWNKFKIHWIIGEGDDDTGGDAGDTGGDAGNTGGDAGNTGKTFTQDDLNKILAKEKRSMQAKIDEAVKQIETLKIAEEDREKLQDQIKILKTENVSKETKLTRDLENLRKKYEADTKQISEEKETWQKRFADAMIRQSVTSVASANLAFDPDQIHAQLKDNLVLRESVDDEGKPTGEFEVIVAGFRDKDKDGKEVKIDLSVTDAVKRMRDMTERFGNLFRTEANSGLSLHGSKPPEGEDKGPDLKDPAKYREWRKKNKEKVFGKEFVV